MTCHVLGATLECRGLCHDSCTAAPMTAAEVAALQEASGLTFEPSPSPFPDRFFITRPDGYCQALVDGRCAGYDARPGICRIYGMVKALPCDHGCQPSRWLTDREVGPVLGYHGTIPDGLHAPSVLEIRRWREAQS